MRVIRNQKVKARRHHICGGCMDRIFKNTIHTITVCEDGGRVFTCRTCRFCDAVLRDSNIEEYGEGELREESYEIRKGMPECQTS
jgi:hypothetical protein